MFCTTNQQDLTTAVAQQLAKGSSPRQGGAWTVDVTFDEARLALAESFAGTDKVAGEPIMTWTMSELKCSTEMKRQFMALIIGTMLVEESATHDHFTLACKTEDGTIASTAVVSVVDPSHKPGFLSGFRKQLREIVTTAKIIKSDGVPEIFKSDEHRAACDTIRPKADAFYKLMPEWHKQVGPSGRHWYLPLVAANPELQGQGYGSGIMRKISELADAHQVDCYLETSGDKNRVFYQRLGYEVVGKKIVEDPTKPSSPALEIYLMTRQCTKA